MIMQLKLYSSRFATVGVASQVAPIETRKRPQLYAWISDSVKQWIMSIATEATDSLCRRNSDKEAQSAVQPSSPPEEPTPDVVVLSTNPPEVDPTTVPPQGDPTIFPQHQMLDTLLKNLPSQILPMLPSQLFATASVFLTRYLVLGIFQHIYIPHNATSAKLEHMAKKFYLSCRIHSAH